MRLSKKTYYGLQALVVLSQASHPLPLAEISRRSHTPPVFLEKILQILRKHNLVISKKGVHGGYSLKRDPKQISLSAILQSLEGPIISAPCTLPTHQCAISSYCQTQDFWSHFESIFSQQFEKITLDTITRNTSSPC